MITPLCLQEQSATLGEVYGACPTRSYLTMRSQSHWSGGQNVRRNLGMTQRWRICGIVNFHLISLFGCLSPLLKDKNFLSIVPFVYSVDIMLLNEFSTRIMTFDSIIRWILRSEHVKRKDFLLYCASTFLLFGFELWTLIQCLMHHQVKLYATVALLLPIQRSW